MISFIYSYRDKKLGAFTQPLINNIEPKRAAVAFSRGVSGLSEDQKSKMIDFDLYFLGTYDDETGNIKVSQPEYILSLDSVIKASEVVKDEQSNDK